MKKYKASSRQEILEGLVITLIEKEQFPIFMKKAFSIPPDIPLANWSLGDQFICFGNDCYDCRGKKQWNEVRKTCKKWLPKGCIYLRSNDNKD